MIFSYRYEDDSREKEGDLAREGFVHIVTVESDDNGYDLREVVEWCEENIKHGWKEYSCSAMGKVFSLMYFKSIEEVVWTKMMWG